MAETQGSLQLTLDPVSLILSQCSDSFNLQNFQFTTDSYFMDRGPRYDAYAQLRESKLRSKRVRFEEEEEEKQEPEIPRSEYTPPVKKSVRFQGNNLPSSGRKKQGSSVLAQSVPDFSAALRKENRKPPPENQMINRIPRAEKCVTPPAMPRREKMYGSGTKLGGGSKSVNNTAEKQSSGGGRLGMMGRKSYASIEELKGLSIAASSAINGENRGGRRSNVLRKSTVLSTRYY